MFCSSDIDWSATAAWAQAILSALAIFAAVWLQDRDRRIRAEDRQRSRKAAIIAIARNAIGTLEQLDRRSMEGQLTKGRFGFYEDELSADLATMAAIDLSQLEDAELAADLMKLRRLVTTARRRLVLKRTKGEEANKRVDRFSSAHKQASKIVARMAGELPTAPSVAKATAK